MILYEFEGKKLLSAAGISVPTSQILKQVQDDITVKPPLILKAQVLSGKRADVGGILFSENDQETRDKLQKLLGKTINNEKVDQVLVEEKVKIEKEFYVSLSYDTDYRSPILSYSESGGTGIEERGVQTYSVDPLRHSVILNDHFVIPSISEEPQGSKTESRDLSASLRDDKLGIPNDLIQKLINLFFDQDCLLLEINPLVKTPNGWMALDAKVKLDESASGRHEDWQFPQRGVAGHKPTQRELAAKKIDEGDYRGVAGSAFFDLPGDIAIMSSGGGASLVAMDALIKAGGSPANFTEYSGNPPKEKVFKLTQVVLNKPGLHGLWIVGGVANFTDIYITISAIVEALREVRNTQKMKLDFPIVVRRGGPNDKQAFEMLREIKDFNLHLYGQETSIPQSAKIMAELAKEYAERSLP